MSQFGGRGVLVVRNPYKAILSYWNFKVRLYPVELETKAKRRFMKISQSCRRPPTIRAFSSLFSIVS